MFFAYLLQFAMAVWVYFQCSESVAMRSRFLGVISAIKNHRNPNMYDSEQGYLGRFYFNKS